MSMVEELMLGTKKFEWNEEAERKFNEAFDSIDSDHNGKLTFDEVKEVELRQALRLMEQCPTDTEIKEYTDKLDKDGDGAVTREEFKQYVTEVIEILQDPKKSMDYAVEVMFKACDIDKNGLISKQEFQSFIEKNGASITEKEINEVFQEVDMDGDTCNLSKEELLKVLLIGREAKRQQVMQQRKN